MQSKVEKWAPPKVVRFSVAGRPVPKLRARENYRTPEATVAWELAIAWAAAIEAGVVGEEPALDGDVYIAVRVRCKNKRHGDLSNLLKAVEDALEGKPVKFRKRTEAFGVEHQPGDAITVGRVYKNDKAIKAILAELVEGVEEQGVDVVIVGAGLDGWAILAVEMAKWSGGGHA